MTAEKKSIIHLIDDLRIGGAQKVLLDICASANLDKYNVSLYLLGDRTDLLSTYDLDPRITIRSFGLPFDGNFSFRSYLERAFHPAVSSSKIRSVLDAVETDCPDILHVHLVPRDLNLGILIQQNTGCELVYTQHLLANLAKKSLGTRLLALILRFTYRKYDLIAVSTTVYDEIMENGLLGKRRKLYLIENKLNVRNFIRQPLPKKTRLDVVYVARIAAVKGHIDLINAWSVLQNDNSSTNRLIIVGPDDMNGQMQALARDVGVADTIGFLGSQNNVTQILNEADIAVFPSHQEGLPLALLEKMAMRLPVLVSDIPELTAVIKDGENGMVFRCGDHEDMAEKLGMLLRDPELRRRLGDSARKTVEERFGSTNIASANEAVYEEIISRG